MRRFYLQGMGRLLAIPIISIIINKMIFVNPSQIPSITFVSHVNNENTVFISVGSIVCISFISIIFVNPNICSIGV